MHSTSTLPHSVFRWRARLGRASVPLMLATAVGLSTPSAQAQAFDPAAAAAAAVAAAVVNERSATFAATGAPQSFTVPTGVSQVTIVAQGGSGGAGSAPPPGVASGAPGRGAMVAATVPVQAGQRLQVLVGSAGLPAQGESTSGGGGGLAGSVGAGTGGRAEQTIAYTQPGYGGGGGAASEVLGDSGPLVVAAGGGGGGGGGSIVGYSGGDGGNADANGSDGSGAGAGGGGVAGQATTGAGADGSNGQLSGGGGGGGGGGYSPPGGGGSGGTGGSVGEGGGGGGGGGRSFVSPTALVGSSAIALAQGPGDGQVTIGWAAPAATASATSLASNANPSNAGDPLTFTATVAAQTGSGVPTGTVQFYDGTSPIGGPESLVNGQTSIRWPLLGSLAPGSYSLSGIYSGDANFAGSTGSLTQVVNRPSAPVTVTSSSNPSAQGQSVTFTAAVAANGYGTPTGDVRWAVDGGIVANTPLSNGQTTFTTSALKPGTNTIAVHYRGDTSYAPTDGFLVQQAPLAIHAGGPAVSDFLADADFSGGTTGAVTTPINTAGLTNAAPPSVYQSRRFGKGFTYTIPGLVPTLNYTVRLHFAETVFSAAGQRLFSVSGNGSPLLSKLDVFSAAGGQARALVEQVSVSADANGVITLTFTGDKNNAMVSGMEVGTY